MNEILICGKIEANSVLSASYLPFGIPEIYSCNTEDVKAIVLGADPSNFTDNGETVIIRKVFDLPDGNPGYFASIQRNLNAIGLNKDNIYVQNVVRNYMNCETGENKLWFEFAEMWKPLLKEDLDTLDPKKKLPVLATAEMVLDSLLLDRKKQHIPAKDYFEKNIIIPPQENYLERNLIPCFRRHYPYSEYPEYVKLVKSIIS